MTRWSGHGYNSPSRARARHGRSTSSTANRSANLGSREGHFGFGPASGRGPGAALTGSFDLQETLALLKAVEHGSLTRLREKPAKIGAKVVHHGRYVTFQLAEVAAPRNCSGKS